VLCFLSFKGLPRFTGGVSEPRESLGCCNWDAVKSYFSLRSISQTSESVLSFDPFVFFWATGVTKFGFPLFWEREGRKTRL